MDVNRWWRPSTGGIVRQLANRLTGPESQGGNSGARTDSRHEHDLRQDHPLASLLTRLLRDSAKVGWAKTVLASCSHVRPPIMASWNRVMVSPPQIPRTAAPR